MLPKSLHVVKERSAGDHGTAIVKTLLRVLRVPYDELTIERDLVRAPSYPSLASISAALARWGIDSEGLEVETESLAELPTPFIAYLRDRRYFLVTEVLAEGAVRGVDTRSGESTLARTDFDRRWTGVALTASPKPGASATSPEGRAHGRLERMRWAAAVGAALGLAALLAAGAKTIPALVFAMLEVAGIAVSALLVDASIGRGDASHWVCTGEDTSPLRPFARSRDRETRPAHESEGEPVDPRRR